MTVVRRCREYRWIQAVLATDREEQPDGPHVGQRKLQFDLRLAKLVRTAQAAVQPVHRGAGAGPLPPGSRPAGTDLPPWRASLCLRRHRPSQAAKQYLTSDTMIEPVPSRLCKDRSEAGKHLAHDRFRDGFEAFPLPCGEVEDARLIAADHPGRPGAPVVERHRESASARKVPSRSDRQDDGRSGQLVERRGRDDHDRPNSPLFMAGRGTEADQPDIAPLHYSNSPP